MNRPNSRSLLRYHNLGWQELLGFLGLDLHLCPLHAGLFEQGHQLAADPTELSLSGEGYRYLRVCSAVVEYIYSLNAAGFPLPRH